MSVHMGILSEVRKDEIHYSARQVLRFPVGTAPPKYELAFRRNDNDADVGGMLWEAGVRDRDIDDLVARRSQRKIMSDTRVQILCHAIAEGDPALTNMFREKDTLEDKKMVTEIAVERDYSDRIAATKNPVDRRAVVDECRDVIARAHRLLDQYEP